MFDYRTQSNDWCSIEFWFDFVRLDTSGDCELPFISKNFLFQKTLDLFSLRLKSEFLSRDQAK